MRFFRTVFFGSLVLSCFSCSTLDQLRVKVDRSARAALAQSELNGAQFIGADLKIQKNKRDLYLAEVDKCLQECPNDSVTVIEFFAGGCLSCPAERVEIFASNKVVVYQRSAIDGRYARIISQYSDDDWLLASTDYTGVLPAHLLTKPKISDVLQLSYNRCPNNGHQIYTLIIPQYKVQSIYLNCLNSHLN